VTVYSDTVSYYGNVVFYVNVILLQTKVEHRPKPLRQKLSNVAIRPPRVAQQRHHHRGSSSDEENEGSYDSLNKPIYERDSWVHSVDELLRRSVHYHVKVL